MATTAPLSDQERDALESGLNLAAAMAGGERPLSAAHVQGLYDGFLGKENIAEAIGVVGLAFGELILPRGPFEWLRKTDEFGEETCLGVKGYELFCYPISMIQRRLEDGEAVEIEMLAGQTVMEMNKLVESGGAAAR